MGLASTIARRSLLQRPGRTLFSVLGIALGIATVVGVVTLDHNTILGLSIPHQNAVGPDIDVRPAAGRAGTSDDLREIEGVSSASRYFQNDAVVRTAPGARGEANVRRSRLFALEAATIADFDVHRLARGRELDPGAVRREVLIGGALAEALQLDLGDKVWLSRPKRVGKKTCVDGELVEVAGAREDVPVELEFEVVGILLREKLGRRSKGMVCLIDYAFGTDVYRGVHVEQRYWARRDPKVDVERLKASLGQSYSYELDKGVVLGQAADERAFRTGVRLAGLLALVLGMYVIFHTLSMSLHERIGEVGTLSAIGATRSQVARVFLLEAVLLAGLGALVGLVGGLLLARGLLAAGITTLGAGKHVGVFVVPWGTVASLAAVGFVIALIGSVYPLFLLRGTSSVAALRGDDALRTGNVSARFHLLYALLLALVLPSLYFVIVPVVGEFTGELVSILLGAVGFLAFVIVLSLIMPAILAGVCAAITRPFTRRWPLAGRLAARSMHDAPTRIGVSAAAIALVTAGFVGLEGMTSSLRGEVEEWADEAVLDKIWIRSLPPTSFDALAGHLREFPGVVGVEKGNARIYAPFLIQGVAVDQLAGYGPCADDASLLKQLAGGHGIVLSRRLAADLGYAVGDDVQVAKADGSVQAFEVASISDAYGHYPYPDERMYGIVADHYIEKYFCIDADSVDEVAVRLAPGTDAAEGLGVVRAAVRDLLPEAEDVNYKTGREVLDHHLFDLDRDFVLFDVLILLTAALAGLGVLNGQLLAALERMKEIGVLKALGTSRAQVAGMVVLESLILGLVGGLLGAALGAGLTPLVVAALEGLAGMSLPVRSPVMWMLIGVAGAVIVCVLAAVYPIWRMNRFDAVRSVRTG
ncbi:MAG: ABC transporter permease [bacterium]|nr:ABC transporter permease [bacterium]